jgi:hypothetical protein
LQEALKAQSEWRQHAVCPREDSFDDVYQVLGDAMQIQAIMEANPQKTHCRFLQRCPVACLEFPEVLGIGDTASVEGQSCPNNPYIKYAGEYQQWQSESSLLEDASYYGDLADIHLLPGLDQLTPDEFLLARIMRQHRKAEEMRALILAVTAPFRGSK